MQVFTNPLWTLLMAGVAAVTGEFYYTAMVVSFAVLWFMLAVIWRWLDRPADGWLALALLVSSKSFVDYSSSGLEYPLTYLLLATFVTLVLGRPDCRPPRLPALVFVASLGFLNRADMTLLYAPALAWLLSAACSPEGVAGRRKDSAGRSARLGLVDLCGHLLRLSVPEDDDAKAQSGMPQWLQVRQGFAYTVSSLRFDPITLATIAASVGVAMVAGGSIRLRLLAAGAGTYVLYTIWVGGDFMAGRFFAAPFLVSALLLAYLPKQPLPAPWPRWP